MKGSNTSANSINGPDAFMPENAAWRTGRNVAFKNMQVSTADSRPHYFHDRIAGSLYLWLGLAFNSL